MRNFFITGTDTEVGKTFVACALLVALRARGIRVAPMKPVAAGVIVQNGTTHNEDVHALLAAYGSEIDASLVNPYCFAEPVAPHIAAMREARTIDLEVIEKYFNQLAASHDGVLVEGAGGFLVPLSMKESMASLPVRLGLEVILVVGLRLGCLNHALLTVEAIHARGLKLAGWVANTLDSDMTCRQENISSLKQLINAPCLGVLPRVVGADVRETSQLACAHLHVDALLKP